MITARPLLGACMIVKDEAKTIEKTIKSLIQNRIEYLTVLDTGSSDGTQDIIRNCNISTVVLVEEAFAEPFDYAKARNRVLEIAAEQNPTQFTLMFSADETLSTFNPDGTNAKGENLREFLEKHLSDNPSSGAFCVMMRVDTRQFLYPRLLRTGGGWKYVNNAGFLHESPVGPEGAVDAPGIPGVYVIHEESDPERKQRRMRDRDLPVLMRVVEDETQSLEMRAEAIFQAAETHFALGHKEHIDTSERGGRWLSHLFQSMALYTRYAELAEMPESRVYDPDRALWARTMFTYVAETFGLFEGPELAKRLMIICAANPRIPEPYWLLTKAVGRVDARKAITLAMKTAKVARAAYDNPVRGAVDVTLEWKSLLYGANAAKTIKDKKSQKDLAQQALAAGAPPEMVEDFMREVAS